MEDKHVVQVRSIPIEIEELAAAHSAMDVGHQWKEEVNIVAEWGTLSPELQEDTSKLAEYIFNVRLPIVLLGVSKELENEIYSKVCKLMFKRF